MDLLTLRRLLRELGPRLAGARVDKVYAIPRDDLALVVGQRGAPRLWFSAEPEQPHLYERRGPHPSPERPPAFAMAARKDISGRRIAALEAIGDDRVVALRWSGPAAGSLVFELIPQRATAMLVDPGGTIRAVWQPRRGRPGTGQPYRPPEAPPRREPDALSGDDWNSIERHLDNEAVARALLRTVRGTSLLIAREATHRHAQGIELRAALQIELERAREQETAARIYAPSGIDELHDLPAARRFLLAPYELAHAGDLVAHPFPTLREAAAAFYPLRARLRLLGRARTELDSALDVATARTHRTLEAVERDRATLREPERYRRWADLLLAHPEAVVEGRSALVPDDYGSGETLSVPIDPARSLPANAEAYYKRARRAERSARHTEERMAGLEARLGRLQESRRRLGGLRGLADSLRLARRAAGDGAAVRFDRWRAPEAGFPASAQSEKRADAAAAAEIDGAVREPTASVTAGTSRASGRQVEPGIVSYRSVDGTEILVGRNARANDRLTHRLAAPHDWWLHAEGPGSHVVIRNERREKEPPERTLQQAAALAAHFSFARDATKVNVRWTQIRHLKRPKGSPPGTVLLRRYQTILAEPVAPEEPSSE